MRYLLLAALLPCAAYGQSTSRQWHSLALQPEVQAELTASPQAYAYLALGGLRYSDENTNADRTLGLDVRYAAAGYEKQFRNERWSWGGTLRVAGAADIGPVVQPGLLLRHRSLLGPFTLGQRLGVEYAFSDKFRFDPAYNISSTAASPTLVRFRLDFYPTAGYRAGNSLVLTPRLSFEPALFLRLQRDEDDLEKRTIDYTGLRADLNIQVAKTRLELTPWVALQTQYLRTIIQTDATGNPTSNGKLNNTLPTAGLEVRYSLSRAVPAEGRFKVPTQH